MMMTEAHVSEVVVVACADAVEAMSLSPGPAQSGQIFPEKVEPEPGAGAALPCIVLDADDAVVESGELRWPPCLALSLAASSDLHQHPGSSPDPGRSTPGRVEESISTPAAGFCRQTNSAAGRVLELVIDLDMNSAAAADLDPDSGSSHGPEIVVSSLDPAEPAESGELMWPPAHLMVKEEDDDDDDDDGGGDEAAADDDDGEVFAENIKGKSQAGGGGGGEDDDVDDDRDDDMKEVPDDRDDTAAVTSMEPDEDSHAALELVDPREDGAERTGSFGEGVTQAGARGMEACVSMEEEEEDEEEEEVEFEEVGEGDEEEVDQDEGDDDDDEEEEEEDEEEEEGVCGP